jgi:hypothetical protein
MVKYDKRRALFCKLLKKSDTHKGYYKYLITVGEKDGTIVKYPVYGKDMQGALSKLINKERTNNIEKNLETNTGLIFLMWLVIVGTPAILTDTSSPWFLAYAFGSVALLILLASLWYNYIKKGEDNV